MVRAGFFCWIALNAASAAWIATMALDNERPYAYLVEGSKISPNPAPQGSMIEVDWRLQHPAKRVCVGNIQRYFYNADTGDLVTSLDTTPGSRAVKPGAAKVNRSFHLPPGLPPNVDYQAEVCWECNPLQRFFPICAMTPKLRLQVF